jgi:hypothetical protein
VTKRVVIGLLFGAPKGWADGKVRVTAEQPTVGATRP